MVKDTDYIEVARKNGCTLIYNTKLIGHVLYYKGVSEIIFHLDKKSIEQFESYCKEFVKRLTVIGR